MRPPKVTDEQILAAARKIFVEHGANAPVDLIASELGISQPALFKRFKTKKNLLVQALQPPAELPEWVIKLEKGPDERPFHEQFQDLCRDIMIFLAEITPVIRVVHTSGINFAEMEKPDRENPYLRDIRIMSGWLERCYKKGYIRKINFTLAAHSIMGTLRMDTLEMSMQDNLNSKQIMDRQLAYLNECMDILLNGLHP